VHHYAVVIPNQSNEIRLLGKCEKDNLRNQSYNVADTDASMIYREEVPKL